MIVIAWLLAAVGVSVAAGVGEVVAGGGVALKLASGLGVTLALAAAVELACGETVMLDVLVGEAMLEGVIAPGLQAAHINANKKVSKIFSKWRISICSS